jgi:hypothetical protein
VIESQGLILSGASESVVSKSETIHDGSEKVKRTITFTDDPQNELEFDDSISDRDSVGTGAFGIEDDGCVSGL